MDKVVGMKCFCFYFKYLYLVPRICISYKNLQYFIVKLHSDPGRQMTTRTGDNEQELLVQIKSAYIETVHNGAIEVGLEYDVRSIDNCH